MTHSGVPSPESPAPVRFVLPWPPTVNLYWRHDRGTTHVSKKGKQYRGDVLAAVWSAAKRPTITGRIEMVVTLFQRRPGAKCDMDNFSKGLLDALAKAGVYANDNQIDRLTVIRGARCDRPRAEVEIIEVGNGVS
jgi:crossover junction endodeoxyribonuclease RusA